MLTKEQYTAKLKEVRAQIEAAKQAEINLKNQWMQQEPLNIGDLVDVTTGGDNDVKVRCFISVKMLRGWDDFKVCYDFCKIKKDGTPSVQSAGIYSYSKIKLVK